MNQQGQTQDEKLGYPDLSNAVIENDSILYIPHFSNLLVANQSSLTNGFFVQYDLKLDRFRLGAGGRFDRYSIIDHAKDSETKGGNFSVPV